MWPKLNTCMPRKVYNLERDVRAADWVTRKIRGHVIYAQNFYAALCNNSYVPKDVWGILTNITWDTTWRHSAEIIADIRECEDFTAWYCSGINFMNQDFAGFVEESYVTPEVGTDISELGWILPTKRFVDF